jgi:hypothetical protein
MIYNTTSSKRVVAKVFSDLNLQEENHRISDILEWVSEGLEKIGAFPTFNIKITGKEDLPLLTVADYQTKLPADLLTILGVQYSNTTDGVFIPLRHGTGTYGPRGEDTTTSTSDDIAPDSDVVTAAMTLYGMDYETALAYINANPNTKEYISSLLITGATVKPANVNSDDYLTLDYVYYINNNYIKLNVKDGYLKIAYQAMPLDEEGYPLIPDNQSFVEALYWYVVMKYYYPEWLGGRIRDEQYYDARRNWNFYCKQAYGVAMMPSVDKLESIKNKWLQLYPEIDEFDNLFSTMGQKQIIY